MQISILKNIIYLFKDLDATFYKNLANRKKNEIKKEAIKKYKVGIQNYIAKEANKGNLKTCIKYIDLEYDKLSNFVYISNSIIAESPEERRKMREKINLKVKEIIEENFKDSFEKRGFKVDLLPDCVIISWE